MSDGLSATCKRNCGHLLPTAWVPLRAWISSHLCWVSQLLYIRGVLWWLSTSFEVFQSQTGAPLWSFTGRLPSTKICPVQPVCDCVPLSLQCLWWYVKVQVCQYGSAVSLRIELYPCLPFCFLFQSLVCSSPFITQLLHHKWSSRGCRWCYSSSCSFYVL